MGDTAVKTPAPRVARAPRPPVLRRAANALRAPEAQAHGPFLQPALIVGPANDPLEREAEAMADRVTAMPEPVAPVQAAPVSDAPTQDSRPLQESPEPVAEPRYAGDYDLPPDDPSGPAGGPAPDDVAATVRNSGLGRFLPGPVRRFMERRFGTGFGDVRVHDTAADQRAARRIGARAFAHGSHIWLGEGESTDDRHLMAHELTHVVQQRGGTVDTAQPEIARDFEINLGIGDAIADTVRDLLRRYAPDVEPVITQGPVQWLRGRLAGVFDAVVGPISRLDPGSFVDQLVETFNGMVTTATEIMGALVDGDCGPLFAALTRLKTFALTVAGEAWAKLTDFFSPVSEFFTDLWASVSTAGAAALEWIQEVAGDVWQVIEDMGTWIWDQTQPIRDYAGMAWDWVKEQLFGPAESSAQGDSRGGIIGWFSDKAAEAWDWVRDQTRPVWEPVNQAIETVNEMIPPAFIASLGEDMQRFSEDMEGTLDEMDDGGSVAENREALAGIIPSVDEVITGIRAAIDAAGTWLIEKLTLVSTKVTTFMTRLRGSSIVSALANRLTWLENAIASLLTWGRGKVKDLFDLLVRGFDFLTPYLRRIIDIVRSVISVYADLLQLPMLIAQAAWNLIPECIREPIKDFVIEQILSRIPVFNQFLEVRNLWNRLQETALTILRALFVDGDIAKAAWTFFREMLALIGLPARLVTGIITKAAMALGRILQDPIGFLINVLRAIKEGFSRFFSNILTHLMNGVTGWLFGTVSEAGLKPPTEFSVRGVLGFILQILDITLERILARLALRIGQDKVDRIRSFLNAATGVWRFVSVLLTEGVSGLWEFVQEQLSNLWTLVLNSVVGWITTRIIASATEKILSMLDPSGIMAVIQSCLAIYRAIETFVEKLREMLEIVSRVLDGVNEIATGAIDSAAGYLEDALGRSLPIAIAFLANQVGLGGLANRIQEFVEAVRERVNQAIDWVINQAIRLGRGFLNLLERGAGAVREGVAALREWWRGRQTFRNEAGEEHSVYVQGQGGSARVMIASETPRTYSSFISDVVVDTSKQAYKQRAVTIAEELDTAIRTAAADTGTTTAPDGSQQPTNDHATIIQGLLDRLATETAHFMPAGASEPSTDPVYGARVDDFGSTATVLRLSRIVPTGGGPPSSSLSNTNWDALRRRGGNNSTYYIRGHLLNDNIGGPGNTWDNLTPLTQEANNRSEDSHLRGFEHDVKQAVLNNNRAVNFVCTARYGRTVNGTLADEFASASVSGGDENDWIARIIRAESAVPLTLQCSARELNADGSPGTARIYTHTVQNTIATTEDSYSIYEGASPKTRLVINSLSNDDLTVAVQRPRGVGPASARALVNARRDRILNQGATPGRGFTRHEQIETALGAHRKKILYIAYEVVLGQGTGTEHLNPGETAAATPETDT